MSDLPILSILATEDVNQVCNTGHALENYQVLTDFTNVHEGPKTVSTNFFIRYDLPHAHTTRLPQTCRNHCTVAILHTHTKDLTDTRVIKCDLSRIEDDRRHQPAVLACVVFLVFFCCVPLGLSVYFVCLCRHVCIKDIKSRCQCFLVCTFSLATAGL